MIKKNEKVRKSALFRGVLKEVNVKKKIISIILAVGLLTVSACGAPGTQNASTDDAAPQEVSGWEAIPIETQAAPEVTETVETVAEETVSGPLEVPAGMYLSELTGEPISIDLKDQRPIAAMIDNEKTALDHYGTAEADIVYELMNSTLNDRVTRLMVLVKDWESIEQLGSIRSVRTSNFPLAGEWNAVICHDGGPFFIDQYLAKGYVNHFSGTFSRVNNGKPREFTEYILPGDLDKNFKNSGYSTTYNKYANSEPHFQFAAWGTEVDMEAIADCFEATSVSLPFYHNGSKLIYNEETETYDYYDYGAVHKDAEDGEVLTFTNVLIQGCPFESYGEGYMNYLLQQTNYGGFYLTKGKAIQISWSKTSETGITRYYDKSGKEITLNTGKTYIGIVPSDTWAEVKFNQN